MLHLIATVKNQFHRAFRRWLFQTGRLSAGRQSLCRWVLANRSGG